MTNPLFDLYLQANGLTAASFAKRLGRHPSAIVRYRNGETRPSLETALRIEELTDGTVPASSWTVRPRRRS